MGCEPSKTKRDGSALDSKDPKLSHDFKPEERVHATVDCNGKRPDQYGFGGDSFWAAKVLPMSAAEEEEHWNVSTAQHVFGCSSRSSAFTDTTCNAVQCLKLLFDPYQFRGLWINDKPKVSFVKIKKVYKWGTAPISEATQNDPNDYNNQ